MHSEWRIFILLVLICRCAAFEFGDSSEVPHENEEEAEHGGGLARAQVYIEDVQYIETATPKPVKQKLSPGEEFTPEKASKSTTKKMELAQEWYEQALRYLERGKGPNLESKKAAYKLIDMAAQAGHKDSQKLIAFAHLFGSEARWSTTEAKQIFESLAADGSPDAHLGLGFMHSTGIGMEKIDVPRALVHYTFSALGGNPLAQMALGYRHLNGIGVERDCEKALFYYETVATKVARAVKFSTGQAIQRLRLTEKENPHGSAGATIDRNFIDYYKFLADKGDVSAQVALGQLYLTGSRGVDQNFDEAYKYFTIAAESGNAAAFAYLGRMYLDGTQVTPQNNATAFQFFMQSAEKNNPIGQASLGIMYLQGRGVAKNFKHAHRLFSLSAEQAWVDGQLYLAFMHFNGLGVKRDFKHAIQFFQLASQSGHILGFYNLAVAHSAGLGVDRSCKIAVEYYKTVAERGRWTEKLMEAYTAYKDSYKSTAAMKYLFLAEFGYEVAQTNFAYIMEKDDSGILFSDERSAQLERALHSWQRAANQEYSYARIKVGDYHFYGMGTEQDYGMALEQYKLAVERHAMPQAMFNLGYMHEVGLGVSKDLHLAKRYFDMAAETSPDAIVPVYLALIKLGLKFGIDYMNEAPVIRYLDSLLGGDWDLALIAVSAVICIVLTTIIFRRQNLT